MGLILILIGSAIVISGFIIIWLAGPEYNYGNYTGFRFPTWLGILAMALGISGALLISYKKQEK